MRSFAVSILLGFVTQASAEEMPANRDTDVQDSMDVLANKLVSKLFDRVLGSSPLYQANLDDTTLDKPGQAAITPRSSVRALPALPRARASWPGYRSPQTALGSCTAMKDPAVRQRMEVAAWAMTEPKAQQQLESKGFQEKMSALLNDADLKPMFDKMEKEGPAAVMKFYSDPEFLSKIAARLGGGQGLRVEGAALAMASRMAQSKDMQEKMAALREDPELKPMFDEMEKEGPTAVIKYYSDLKFLRQVGTKLIFSPAQNQEAQQMVLSMRKTGTQVRANTDTVEDLGSDIGALGLRVISSAMMVHNGLDKLADPSGFAKFVVEPYLHLPEALCLPATYAAAGVEVVAPVLLILGIATRLSSLGLLGTMGAAIVFHLSKTGLEGFPFAVVPAHQYGFETAAIYAAVYAYLALAGAGKFSLDSQLNQD